MVVALTTSFTPIAAKPRDSRLGIFSRTSDRFGVFSFVGQSPPGHGMPTAAQPCDVEIAQARNLDISSIRCAVFLLAWCASV
jgi:hypothetical protein